MVQPGVISLPPLLIAFVVWAETGAAGVAKG
jgi:hypothetical protein